MVTIDGQQIPSPSSLELGKFKLSKGGRTASGLMVMDIIARKRKIELQWSHITDSALKGILDLLESKTFYQVTYPDPQGVNGQATMEAYSGDVSMGLWHTRGGVRYWQSAKISLIER